MNCANQPLIIPFDITIFRTMFKEFSDTSLYPDAVLNMYWAMATCWVSDVNCGWLNGQCRTLALNLMTAHIAETFTQINMGETPVILNSAAIDKISIGIVPPPIKDFYQYNLATTPYGTQLLGILQAKATGGLYIGSFPELSAFRRVGGVFNNGFPSVIGRVLL